MHKTVYPFRVCFIVPQSVSAVQGGTHTCESQSQKARSSGQSPVPLPGQWSNPLILNQGLLSRKAHTYERVKSGSMHKAASPLPVRCMGSQTACAAQEGAHTFESQSSKPRSSAQSRLFPFMVHQRCPDLFSYSSSSFVVQRSKAGTARVVCWQDLGIANRCAHTIQTVLVKLCTA